MLAVNEPPSDCAELQRLAVYLKQHHTRANLVVLITFMTRRWDGCSDSLTHIPFSGYPAR
jgi:hypothetical protein